MKTTRPKNSGNNQSPSFMDDAPSFYRYGESNPNPILITNIQAEIQYVNAAWERLTGYASADVHGMNPRFLNSGKTPPDLYEALWKTLMEGKSFESEEFINRKKTVPNFQFAPYFFRYEYAEKLRISFRYYTISRREESLKSKETSLLAKHRMNYAHLSQSLPCL